ncbi:hypothetical protein BH10PLA2_BH10PLA2_00120 [soil metagenome]
METIAGWLDVTNFAIDRRFLDRGLEAQSTEELQKKLSNDEFFYLAACFEQALPGAEKYGFSSPLVRLYREEPWQVVKQVVRDMDTALHIIRDIFLFHGVRYEDERFCCVQPHAPNATLANIIFNYPSYQPFRLARPLLRSALAEISTEPRDRLGGELGYYIKFRVIDENPQQKRRSFNPVAYVKRDASSESSQ